MISHFALYSQCRLEVVLHDAAKHDRLFIMVKYVDRDEIRKRLDIARVESYEARGHRFYGKDSLQQWCKDNGLYYYGVVRFLKGADITIFTYSRILNAIDPTWSAVIVHYMADKLMYSEINSIKEFSKKFLI